RLRDTRRDDGEAGRALLPDAMEGAHDAHDRTEEADEGRRARRGGEEGEIALHARDLDLRGPLHGALGGVDGLAGQPLAFLEDGVDLLRAAVHGGELEPGRGVELGQRARAELFRGAVEQREAAALTEGAREALRVALDGAELPPLLHDERPADHREEQKNPQDESGQWACLEDRVEHRRHRARWWQTGLLCFG